MDTRRALGNSGEALAASLYERLGFAVVDRNWCCPLGEVDLIVKRGDVLVFCEVKTRRTRAFGEPSEAVGRPKQARLRRLAGAWLAAHRPGRVKVRFDVVSVIVRGGRAEITHLPDAF